MTVVIIPRHPHGVADCYYLGCPYQMANRRDYRAFLPDVNTTPDWAIPGHAVNLIEILRPSPT